MSGRNLHGNKSPQVNYFSPTHIFARIWVNKYQAQIFT